jgi:ribonucleoside-diphosphate reductase alpha chain
MCLFKKMLTKNLQQRYLARTWDEIVTRIMRGPVIPYFKSGASASAPSSLHGPGRVTASGHDLAYLEILMRTKTFIPAGNTLVSGTYHNNTRVNLAPNCSILHDPDVFDVLERWIRNIGMGMCVTKPDDTNPVELMKQFQAAWSTHNPQHRPRRGNMFVYPIDGKFIRDFLSCKENPESADALNAFNISVAVDSRREIPADLLKDLSKAAWSSGDPGVVFMDRVNTNVPLIHKTKRIQTLVPCGEQGMFDGETCTLGSINLNAKSLENPCDGTINRAELHRAVRLAVRFLDAAVSAISTKDKYRRIGLGVMGWADVLERMGLKYGSLESLQYASSLSTFFGACARLESARLAAETSTFPAYSSEDMYVNMDMLRRDMLALPEHAGEISYRKYKLRNVSVTCLPPTGGITLLTDNDGFSIEPFFRDATRLSPEDHIDMADAWQSGMCNAVSKTINLPKHATPYDIEAAVRYAQTLSNLKAVSMYRDSSRNAQPISM